MASIDKMKYDVHATMCMGNLIIQYLMHKSNTFCSSLLFTYMVVRVVQCLFMSLTDLYSALIEFFFPFSQFWQHQIGTNKTMTVHMIMQCWNMQTKSLYLKVVAMGSEHWGNIRHELYIRYMYSLTKGKRNWGLIPQLFHISIHKPPDKHITVISCLLGREWAVYDWTTWWACLHLAQQGCHRPSFPFSEPLVRAPLIYSPRIVAGFRLGSSSSSPHAITRHSFVKMRAG